MVITTRTNEIYFEVLSWMLTLTLSSNLRVVAYTEDVSLSAIVIVSKDSELL